MYDPATNNGGAVWGSTALSRHAGSANYTYLLSGQTLRSYSNAVNVKVVSLTPTTATVEVGFYDPFITRPTPVIAVRDGGGVWVGKTLSALGADASAWAPTATRVSYQWLRDGEAIAGATTASYSLVQADRGRPISVRVTPEREGYRPIPTFSAAVTPDGPAVSRTSGTDRMLTAVEISKQAYPGTAPVVYLATGWNFPDSLAAAPAAAKNGGPLLLVPSKPDQIPETVINRVKQLAPSRIVVLGSSASVPDSVVQHFESALPASTRFDRVAGKDRFQTGNAIVADAFPSSVAEVFVATGNNFPDALSAAAIAGGRKIPVILVNGGADSIDAETLATLKRLKPTSAALKITIVGSPAAVSTGIEHQLRGHGFSVDRVQGSDRYQTSIALNSASFTGTVSQLYLATGSSYADALPGAVLASKAKAPLYVVQSSCVPREVLASIDTNQTENVSLIGGLPTLSHDVMMLRSCG